MLDLGETKYRLIVVTEDGTQYNITDLVEGLSWEEPKKELATRVNFQAKDKDSTVGAVSQIAKPGCLVGVFAVSGNMDDEVARGYVMDWKPTVSNGKETISCVCYDELYYLQKSQDYIYYESIGTESAIRQIFDDWGIPIERYEGPNVTHGKLVYKSENLSEVILDILDDAKKKGAGTYVIQANKGQISILPRGSNTNVYHFDESNITKISQQMSIGDMVTRVKVIGQEDDDEKSSVEATVDGQTDFGIWQKIYTRQKDDSLDEAKKAAQEILDEKGQVKEEISVQALDVPQIRKADLVHVQAGGLDGHYYVEGIRHEANSATMTMDLVKAVPETADTSAAKSYQVGDIVTFHGGTHYVSSYPDAKGYNARAGEAKITIANGSGGAHPWHLIHTDSSSNVYGWVDDGTFE